jgi:hypothetical protein
VCTFLSKDGSTDGCEDGTPVAHVCGVVDVAP